MRWLLLGLAGTLFSAGVAWADPPKIVVADATYIMGDGDTLAGAAEMALAKAKRKAIEEAGVYLEASSQEVMTYREGTIALAAQKDIRTISAAITQTDILEQRRMLDGDRLTFYVKIRATVQIDMLADAVKRIKADEQLADHYRRLQAENAALKNQLDVLRKQPLAAKPASSEPGEAKPDRRKAEQLAQRAMKSPSLPEKIDLASQALQSDGGYVPALIIRGQTYLRVASVAFSRKGDPSEIAGYVDHALADFDRAVTQSPTSPWAWLGRGDARTWQKRPDDAATDYERVLELDPTFDLARERLITLYTTKARKAASSGQWHQVVAILDKAIRKDAHPSWLEREKEALFIRAQAHHELGETDRAIDDLSKVIRVDPAHTSALMLRAQIYRHLLQGRLAKDDFERACALGVADACQSIE